MKNTFELDFRAWYKKEKRYYESYEKVLTEVTPREIKELFDLEQYIGYKECFEDGTFGKKIFAGDIVQCNRYETEDLFLVLILDIRDISSKLFGSELNSRIVIGNFNENYDLFNGIAGKSFS